MAEDDARLGRLLEQSLSEAGWGVRVVHDGEAALGHGLTGDDEGAFDVLLLDWMLPRRDGVGVCRELRRLGVQTPVLMLTARATSADKVTGLDAGADDYLAKPFDLDELLARLRALLRRGSGADEQVVRVGDLTLDPGARRADRSGVEIDLSTREFDILQVLIRNMGRVVSRYAILDEVWDGEPDIKSNAIDVHIASLRAKIDKPFGTNTITTVRGAGYRVDKS